MKSFGYQSLIKELLNGRKYDPRHIEGYLRLKYKTLDALSRSQLKHEIDLCIEAIEYGGEGTAEELAKSYGL